MLRSPQHGRVSSQYCESRRGRCETHAERSSSACFAHTHLQTPPLLFSTQRSSPMLHAGTSQRTCVALHSLSPNGGGKSKGAKPPKRLLSPNLRKEGAQTQDKTVYTVRLSTGQARGSGLSDFSAGVQLCLIGKNGSGFLYRVPALHDQEEVERELHHICQEVDHGAGANCFMAFDGLDRQHKRQGPSGPKHRFQQGGVDEVSFLGPELGPLSSLLVGPEQGRWFCDEVDVSSSRSGHTDRFICREFLGERSDHSAAHLTPIAPDSVVYGSGEDAVVLSKEQAARLYRYNMAQYGDLKARLMAINAGLVAVGTAAIFAHGGGSLAAPFALGGASGMVYQLLMAAGVESVGGAAVPYKAQEIKPGLGLTLQLALASPTIRTALKAGGVVASVLLLHALSTQSGVADQPGGELKQLLSAFAGFLMFKWAILGAAVMPPQQLSQATLGGGRGRSKVEDDQIQ